MKESPVANTRNYRRLLAILLAALVVVGGPLAFIELADEVAEGEMEAFDEAGLMLFRSPGDPVSPLGPVWLQEAGRDITALGGTFIIFLVIVAVSGHLWLDGRRATLAVMLGVTLTGWGLSALLKVVFNRPRPDQVYHLTQVYTASFPSGHSMMSAVVYLTLGVLLAQVANRKRLKFFYLAFSGVVTILVGISRVYLGVHYPTDVLAGWTAGLVWATACLLLVRYLQQRGQLERKE